MMDHENMSVRDGKVVTTKRSLGYSKQKHNGTTFVNLSHAGDEAKPPVAPRHSASADVTFLSNLDGRRKPRISKNLTGPRKKEATKSTTAATDSADSCTTPARALSPTSIHDHQQIHGSASIIPGPPGWSLYNLPKQFPDSSKRLFHICFTYGSIIAFPLYEFEILTHNPLRSPEGYRALVQDPTAVQCALAMGALYDTVRSGKQDSQDLLSSTLQLYPLINEKLGTRKGTRSTNSTMIVISVLAMIAVRLPAHIYFPMATDNLAGLSRQTRSLARPYESIAAIR
jgi:hypothetical protein